MGLGDTIDYTSEAPNEPLNPARLFAAVLFAVAVTSFLVFIGWLVWTAPVKVEIHEREGQIYECSYWRDGDIVCLNMNDSNIGGGKITP